MQLSLQPIERDAFMEIVNIGLTKAADAMSAIIGECVFIKCVQTMRAEEVYKDIDYYHLNIVTEVYGDIEATCCLVFTPSDAQYLTSKKILKKHHYKNSTMDEMDKDFLMELDNQIAAAVISQLSDSLQLKLYGDLPRIEHWNTMKSTKTILNDRYVVFFRTQFRTTNINFSPGFYWFFEPKIISVMKNFSQKKLTT